MYCPIAKKEILPPKTGRKVFGTFMELCLGDVEDMADILLTKAKDIDLTEGCRDCGGCEMGNTGRAF